MTTFVRGACASLLLGGALIVTGCGGGGSGIATPTATPVPGTTPTPKPTATATPNGSGPITSGQMVFVSTHSGASEIFKANTDGSNPVQLTHLAAQGITGIEKPSVAPDGGRIVFQFGSPANGTGTTNLEIGLVGTNGQGFQQLTSDTTVAGRPDDFQPVFSPDDLYIFWTSLRQTSTTDKVPHIWRMDGAPGNTGANQIVFIPSPSAYPSLDHIGANLAYAAVDQTSSPIAIQPLSGGSVSGAVKRVGGNIAGNTVFNVALSPDGSRVAFSSVASGTAPTSNVSSSATAGLNILSVATGASLDSANLTTTSNGGSAWSRDSQTLFFDAAGGSLSNRQVFSLNKAFSTPTQVTTSAPGANYSPAFPSGN